MWHTAIYPVCPLVSDNIILVHFQGRKLHVSTLVKKNMAWLEAKALTCIKSHSASNVIMHGIQPKKCNDGCSLTRWWVTVLAESNGASLQAESNKMFIYEKYIATAKDCSHMKLSMLKWRRWLQKKYPRNRIYAIFRWQLFMYIGKLALCAVSVNKYNCCLYSTHKWMFDKLTC